MGGKSPPGASASAVACAQIFSPVHAGLTFFVEKDVDFMENSYGILFETSRCEIVVGSW